MSKKSTFRSLYDLVRPPRIDFDGFGDERLQDAIRSAIASRIRPVQRMMQSVRSGPWDRRGFYNFVVGPFVDPRPAEDWWLNEPENPDASLIFGECKIAQASRARGYGRASEVSAATWEVFGERMAAAWESLQASAQVAPEDPTPFSPMMKIVMSNGGTLEQGQALFQAAVERDPRNLLAHLAYGYLLSQKWLGSHEMSFEFARSVALDAEPGSDLVGVLFRAHIERWVYYRLFEQNPKAAKAYIGSQEVRQEVATYFDRTMGVGTYKPRAGSAIVWNFAAFWFFLTRDVDRLRISMQRLGTAFGAIPWCYAEEGLDRAIAKAQWKGR